MAETEPPNELVPRPGGHTPVFPLFRAERLPAPRPEVIAEPAPAPARLHPSLSVLAEPAGARAASFRALRQRLVERGDPRTVLVTSAEPGEGATTVAANLALAMAEARKYRVLLIEANARAPVLAGRLGLTPEGPPCFLAQLARHRIDPDEPWRVAAFGPTELHVLPVRAAPPAPAIDAPGFAAALDQLRQRYDYLVVDGPPVLGGPDLTLLEDAADGLVLAVAAGRTRGRAVRAALEQVLPAEVFGLVLVASP